MSSKRSEAAASSRPTVASTKRPASSGLTKKSLLQHDERAASKVSQRSEACKLDKVGVAFPINANHVFVYLGFGLGCDVAFALRKGFGGI